MCKDNKTHTVVIEIMWGVFFLLLLGMCTYQVCKMVNPDKRNIPPTPKPEKVYIKLQITDTVIDTKMMARLDSLRKDINAWNNYSEERYLHGLDDIRQETNNIIDKQNGWFSFWLGILTIVGALLPFIFQLKLKGDQEQDFEAAKEQFRVDIEKEKDDLKKGLEKEKDDLKKGLEKEKDDLKKDLEKEKQIIIKESDKNKEIAEKCEQYNLEREKTTIYSEITKLTYIIITCRENKWSKNYLDKNLLWNDLLSEIRIKVNHLMSLISSNKEVLPENVYYVKMILLQLHAVYSTFIPTCTQSYKSRKLLEIIKEIGDMLESIVNNSSDPKKLYDDMNKMLLHIDGFTLENNK